MPLTRLLYISNSCLRETDVPAYIQVHEIAHASAKRNASSNLTGVLLFVEDHFIQVLEGEDQAIEETFEKICCDLRHTNVRLVDLHSVNERMFPEWGMKVLSETQDTSVALRDDLAHIHFLVGVNARAAVEQMRKYLDSYDLDAQGKDAAVAA